MFTKMKGDTWTITWIMNVSPPEAAVMDVQTTVVQADTEVMEGAATDMVVNVTVTETTVDTVETEVDTELLLTLLPLATLLPTTDLAMEVIIEGMVVVDMELVLVMVVVTVIVLGMVALTRIAVGVTAVIPEIPTAAMPVVVILMAVVAVIHMAVVAAILMVVVAIHTGPVTTEPLLTTTSPSLTPP